MLGSLGKVPQKNASQAASSPSQASAPQSQLALVLSSALGEAIAELALDPELRRSMRNAALAQGVGRTIDDVVADHLDLYRRIIDR